MGSKVDNERPYLTPAEAGDMLGVDAERVIAWGKAGELTLVDVRSPGARRARYRIARRDLDEFLERRRVRREPRPSCRHKRPRSAAKPIEFV